MRNRTSKPRLRSERVQMLQVDGVVCLECGTLVLNPEQHAAFHIRLVGAEVRIARVNVPMAELEQVECHDCGQVVWRHGLEAHNRMHFRHDPREFGMARD